MQEIVHMLPLRAILSEYGSVQLEFKTLYYHTGNHEYWRKMDRIMNIVVKAPGIKYPGLWPKYLDMSTGEFDDSAEHITLGNAPSSSGLP